MTETICNECEHHRIPYSGAHPARWYCEKHKRLEGFGFVTRDVWDKYIPFLPCHQVNGGCCPLFERTKDEHQPSVSEQVDQRGRSAK